ncbi:hypothetical protein EIN_185880 [Entamoeba invadens IP1]|uniref:hypothetical protein n=1 Tax=Entamoeba invadens IP1 TaxID=370355 RepID=UPI0002C3E1FD|nr:hypothetical protein EIN_185880 [Entamoeba invadens IP1]ELP94181.1 hypothetical protein EIN_185880 [Entamoeba invadens IP1]|eukprot:XP_004260952.1 hypothetical protein EIN_185880 [Entamoeba invadens IP1]
MSIFGNEVAKRLMKKKNKKGKTFDEEFQTIRERSRQTEQRLQGVANKISKLKAILQEASILQVDISNCLSELAVDNPHTTQVVNGLYEVTNEILKEQEKYNSSVFYKVEIPLLSFLEQFKILNNRDMELLKRRKEFLKAQSEVTKKKKKNNFEYVEKANELYRKQKEKYMALRNEINSDRSVVMRVVPVVVEDITKKMTLEGCGCLRMNDTTWKKLTAVAQNCDKRGVETLCELITPPGKSAVTQEVVLSKISSVFHARVVYNYNALKQNELTLREGDWVTVLSSNGQWWEGELNGTVGIFPANYVIRDVES